MRPGALEHEERDAAADAHDLRALAARAADVGRVHVSVVAAHDHHGLARERGRPFDGALQEPGIARRGKRWNRDEKRETEANQ